VPWGGGEARGGRVEALLGGVEALVVVVVSWVGGPRARGLLEPLPGLHASRAEVTLTSPSVVVVLELTPGTVLLLVV